MSQHRCVRELEFAYLTHDTPAFARNGRYTPGQMRGIRYERKIVEYLERKHSYRFIPHPWFYYKDRHEDRARWCQPDGLLFSARGRLTICEIKLRHTRDAYYQLFELYLPIVKHVFPGWKHAVVEIVRWFDSAEPTPEKAFLCKEPELVDPGAFGVTICKG